MLSFVEACGQAFALILRRAQDDTVCSVLAKDIFHFDQVRGEIL